MRFESLSPYLTGVLVPVSALRSDENLGVGEFADILPLASWCKSAGLDLIQLLPVNDSGGESSPYSALSAFALHPIYLRISDLPELIAGADRDPFLRSLQEIRDEHADHPRIRYRALLDAKLALTARIFAQTTVDPALRAQLDEFIAANPWIHQYAAFKVLKVANNETSWKDWPAHRNPTAADIDAIWNDARLTEKLTFHVWLQMRLEEQFGRVAREVADAGITLKGDLPILMNEESADVWAHRENFTTRLRAGAPPDMFTSTGQNWYLPVYNWEQLARTGYQWWKDRLKQAAKFYSAYRIDHVLGFFRVWAIPEDNYSGLLGHFFPSVSASPERLHDAGFDDGRIRWLAEPHLRGEEIRRELGDQASPAISLALKQIGDEELYLFGDSIHGERDIQELALPQTTREWLVSRYADRALITLENGSCAPAWSFRSCSRYEKLDEREKESFERLVSNLREESEEIWEEQGRRLLGFMVEATDMLVCAEDLGVIPNAVPRVLSELGMLGLRIPRWARMWSEPGQPYVPPPQFPFLTVCAPSVHDTSTMRGWWDEEPEREAFWSSLGFEGPAPEHYDAATAAQVTAAFLETRSSICIFQLQDILALSRAIPSARAVDERVNVPGTVNDVNWNYRLPISIGALSAQSDLADLLRPLTTKRRGRQRDANA